MPPQETEAGFSLNEHTRIKIPLSLQVTLLSAIAALAIAYATARATLHEHAEKIATIEARTATDHDVLVEIRNDVKRLVREDDRRRQ